jgi:hypothetical protein
MSPRQSPTRSPGRSPRNICEDLEHYTKSKFREFDNLRSNTIARIYTIVDVYDAIIQCLRTTGYSDQIRRSFVVFEQMDKKLDENLSYLKNNYPEYYQDFKEWSTGVKAEIAYLKTVYMLRNYNQVNDDDCVICMDKLKKNNTVVLPCTHKFHINCISEWAQNHYTCPLCRKSINTGKVL